MSVPVLLNNLQRKLGGVTVLKGISAQVLPGQVIALLGKNGAGKTTLLETILGFGFPASGDAKLWDVKATEINGEIKQRIGFVPQQDELLAGMNGWEHLALFKAYQSRWNQTLVDRLIIDWLIPMDTYVGKMSVGQRQKLSILLALAHEPELLVLDEPVASLDPIARRQFLQQLVEIASDENRAVIFSTHIVNDVERVANQVWILRDGLLVCQSELDGLKETLVRVRLTANEPLPEKIRWPYLLRQKNQGLQTQLTIQYWQPDMAQQLANEFNAEVAVEYLSLEDIFLELAP
ncbi:ABC transporter ATP-binding protein [Cellvibrio sp. OA-2007]|uniref:ABC transporter ATP-binding protein n=1 Tax=Cellvibrio sp. OA-2007 TaxID=529823 RepID=UPI0007855C00|nr:ABC transporter ATP-binding protein [Cellvibrio sp. OA-2007]